MRYHISEAHETEKCNAVFLDISTKKQIFHKFNEIPPEYVVILQSNISFENHSDCTLAIDHHRTEGKVIVLTVFAIKVAIGAGRFD